MSKGNIAILVVLVLLGLAKVSGALEESRKANVKREAFETIGKNWRTCSTEEINRRLDEEKPSAVQEIFESVLAKCKVEYQALVDATAVSVISPRDNLQKEIVKQQQARLSHQQKAQEAAVAKQEDARKISLIEAAIEMLKTDGVTEDDLKDYFREAIIQECEENDCMKEDRE